MVVMFYMGAMLDLQILFDWICDGRIVNCSALTVTLNVLIWIQFAILVCVFTEKLIIVQLVPLNLDKKQ